MRRGRAPREAFSHCDRATGKSVPRCANSADRKSAVRARTAPIGGRVLHIAAKACRVAEIPYYCDDAARCDTPCRTPPTLCSRSGHVAAHPASESALECRISETAANRRSAACRDHETACGRSDSREGRRRLAMYRAGTGQSAIESDRRCDETEVSARRWRGSSRSSSRPACGSLRTAGAMARCRRSSCPCPPDR